MDNGKREHELNANLQHYYQGKITVILLSTVT